VSSLRTFFLRGALLFDRPVSNLMSTNRLKRTLFRMLSLLPCLRTHRLPPQSEQLREDGAELPASDSPFPRLDRGHRKVRVLPLSHTHTHTHSHTLTLTHSHSHTHTYIHTYIHKIRRSYSPGRGLPSLVAVLPSGAIARHLARLVLDAAALGPAFAVCVSAVARLGPATPEDVRRCVMRLVRMQCAPCSVFSIYFAAHGCGHSQKRSVMP
jgi:hypothetical protein